MNEVLVTEPNGAVYRETVRTNANGEVYVERELVEEGNTAPTQLDRVEAQATYTAMMTDTLLEEV